MTEEERTAVDEVMRSIIAKTKAPAALRLVFHDAGTFSVQDGSGGANASVRFELDRPENAGLRRPWGFVVEVRGAASACSLPPQLSRTRVQAHKRLEGTAAEGLSYADLIALAGAAAVAVCAGPSYSVLVGRVDAVGPDPEGRLPEETIAVDKLKAVFARQGFSSREFVCLSGAHTVR